MDVMKEEVKLFAKRKYVLTNNIRRAYTYVWCQCTPSLQACVRGEPDYEEKSEVSDLVWMLKVLRSLTAGVDEQANEYLNLYNGIAKLFSMKQFKIETNDAYLDRFNTTVQALDLSNGSFIFECPVLIEKNTGKQMKDVDEKEIVPEAEKFKAMLLLQRSDDARYGDLMRTLKEDSWKGRDEYPTTVTSMFKLMNKHSKMLETRANHNRNTSNGQYTLTQVGNNPNNNTQQVPGADGTTVERTCYNCNNIGQERWNCPSLDETEHASLVAARNRRCSGGGRGHRRSGRGFTQVGTTFLQDRPSGIESTWILLDTCSTASVCNNLDVLSDTRIYNEDEELTVITNGGSQSFKLIGNFKHLPMEDHYNADSLANILSFKHVSEIPGVTITIDTIKDSGILVHMRDGTVYRFAPCASGLYYHNAIGGTMYPEDTVTKPLEESTTNLSNNMTVTVYPTILLNTVAENSKFYSRREIEGA